MIRLLLLLLFSVPAAAAQSTVTFDSAASLYQAAAVRAQVRASLGSMPAKMRTLYANDAAANLSPEQLAIVESSATHAFRIDVFEPPAIAAMVQNLDASAVRESLDFLHGAAGLRMVAADIALAETDEATLERISSGELSAPSSPARDAILDQIESASHAVDSAVQIYLTIARGLAVGSAVGGGLDPIAADQRVTRSADDTVRADIASHMQAPLRRSLAYGYRDLSDADLRAMVAFLDTKAGKKYTAAYIAAMNAGFDAMGQRCGERIGERWRELAIAQHAKTTHAAVTPPASP